MSQNQYLTESNQANNFIYYSYVASQISRANNQIKHIYMLIGLKLVQQLPIQDWEVVGPISH